MNESSKIPTIGGANVLTDVLRSHDSRHSSITFTKQFQKETNKPNQTRHNFVFATDAEEDSDADDDAPLRFFEFVLKPGNNTL